MTISAVLSSCRRKNKFVFQHFGMWLTSGQYHNPSLTVPPLLLPRLSDSHTPGQLRLRRLHGERGQVPHRLASAPRWSTEPCGARGETRRLDLPDARPELKGKLDSGRRLCTRSDPPRLPQPGNHWRCSRAKRWNWSIHSWPSERLWWGGEVYVLAL